LDTAFKLWKECIRGISSRQVAASTKVELVTGALLSAMGKCHKSSLVVSFWRKNCQDLFHRRIPPSVTCAAIGALGRARDTTLLRTFLHDYLPAHMSLGWKAVADTVSHRMWSTILLAWYRCHEFKEAELMSLVQGLDAKGQMELVAWEKSSGVVVDAAVRKRLLPPLSTPTMPSIPLKLLLSEWERAFNASPSILKRCSVSPL
jgi:hypothetical protein